MARFAARKRLDTPPSNEEMATIIADLKHLDDAAAAMMGTAN